MTDFSLKAARLQFAALLAVLVVALAVATGITIGAFVLSFSVLRDLARQGLLQEDLAWIFPAMIDGAIFLSTVAVVVLAKLDIPARDKRFYIVLAAVVICISVYGNAYHAYHAALLAQNAVAAGAQLGFVPLSPVGAALIAIIPPFLVLALTHGVGILVKAIGAAHAQYVAQIGDGVDEARSASDDAGTAVACAVDSAPEALDGTVVLAPDSCDDPRRDLAESGTADGDTTTRLLDFFATTDLDPAVKKTATLKIMNPEWTFAELADATHVRAASTAMRRYKKAEESALEAGLVMPSVGTTERDLQFDQPTELVGV
ncbi:DUF2637 domain-containing protein [Rhodococcoides fascians]|uniref:DUF2637 domain-containing protein n=1 Tax=Rhodococcoides fascians TaxID=1828 RepID=UPI00068F2296|nr:DUF2637 domain-containing protein [Rhodococcus fascians]